MKRTRKAKGTNNQATAADAAIDSAQQLDDIIGQQVITAGFHYVPLPQAHELFRKKMPKKSEVAEGGANEFLDVFLRACEALVSTQQSFTFSDLSMLLRPFQLDPLEVKRVFEQWAAHLEQLGKLDRVSGCYDDCIYIYH